MRAADRPTAAQQRFMIKRRGGSPMKVTRKLAAIACGALGLCAASAARADITLTYSSWVPPTHHLSIWQANWAKEVEKATNGRVKFQGLPKAPAAPPGTFDAVRDDLVDLSFVTASYTPARHILPLMARSEEHTSELQSPVHLVCRLLLEKKKQH